MMQGWYSPLHLACKFGHEQIIWLLLEFGATWSIPDKVLYLALRFACACVLTDHELYPRRRKRHHYSGQCGMAKPPSRIEWTRYVR